MSSLALTVSRLEYEAYDKMLNEKARGIEEGVKQMPGIEENGRQCWTNCESKPS